MESVFEVEKEHELTIADLGLRSTANGKKAEAVVQAKYRDPVSGATWTGRGRAPAWATEAKAAGKLDSLSIHAPETKAPAKKSAKGNTANKKSSAAKSAKPATRRKAKTTAAPAKVSVTESTV